MNKASILLLAVLMALPWPVLAAAQSVQAAAVTATAPRAMVLDLPTNARRTAAQETDLGSYKVPISRYEQGRIQSVWAEGEVHRQAWQIQAPGLTTLQILAPLRTQLADAGFDTIFECEARDCGGFDFRYATDVLPEPDMHVDLGDFRFISAHRMGSDRPEYITLLVSRSAGRGFVQMIRVGPNIPGDTVLTASTKSPMQGPPQASLVATPQDAAVRPAQEGQTPTLTARLEAQGRAVLEDLDFTPGSATLGQGPFPTLASLASYLKTHPDRSVTLVGHTDAEGSLAANIALSKNRAGAVRQRLADLGVPSGQITADGVGYLSPLTSNLTAEGRSRNRRVEAILDTVQ